MSCAQREPAAWARGPQLRQTRWRERRPPLGSVGTWVFIGEAYQDPSSNMAAGEGWACWIYVPEARKLRETGRLLGFSRQLLLADFMIHGGPTYWWISKGSPTASRERRYCNERTASCCTAEARGIFRQGTGVCRLLSQGHHPNGEGYPRKVCPSLEAFQRGPSLNGHDGGSQLHLLLQKRGFVRLPRNLKDDDK